MRVIPRQWAPWGYRCGASGYRASHAVRAGCSPRWVRALLIGAALDVTKLYHNAGLCAACIVAWRLLWGFTTSDKAAYDNCGANARPPERHPAYLRCPGISLDALSHLCAGTRLVWGCSSWLSEA
jgi:cytochrome b